MLSLVIIFFPESNILPLFALIKKKKLFNRIKTGKLLVNLDFRGKQEYYMELNSSGVNI